MNNETETKWEDEEATLKGEPPEAPRSESDSAGGMWGEAERKYSVESVLLHAMPCSLYLRPQR
jgi:hypothetical protein